MCLMAISLGPLSPDSEVSLLHRSLAQEEVADSITEPIVQLMPAVFTTTAAIVAEVTTFLILSQ